MATLATLAQQPQTRIQTCKEHGEFRSESYLIAGTLEHWTPCPTCDKERERRAAEYQAKIDREQAEQAEAARLRRMNIPPRFARVEVQTYNVYTEQQRRVVRVVEDYVETFASNLEDGRCLIMLGKPGCGKTHLACAIANALDRKAYKVRYSTAAGLIREIRDSWRKESPVTEAEILRKLRRLDLLILDEVGVQFGSDAELTQLTEVLDLRYQDLKPTIIISNCDMAGLVRFLGDRSIDRLRENGGQLITFEWESWRRRSARGHEGEE